VSRRQARAIGVHQAARDEEKKHKEAENLHASSRENFLYRNYGMSGREIRVTQAAGLGKRV
jgi:hypothetical protein